MSRRTAPRPLAAALAGVTSEVAPAGLLARIQAGWAELAGPAVAAEAEPVSERGGTVTVACRSAVWAQELELLSADLRDRLNAGLATPEEAAPVAALRFVVRGP